MHCSFIHLLVLPEHISSFKYTALYLWILAQSSGKDKPAACSTNITTTKRPKTPATTTAPSGLALVAVAAVAEAWDLLYNKANAMHNNLTGASTSTTTNATMNTTFRIIILTTLPIVPFYRILLSWQSAVVKRMTLSLAEDGSCYRACLFKKEK